MKIYFATSEAHPFIKTGGLADVASSLPKALAKNRHDVRVVLPLYSGIDIKYKEKMNFEKYFFLPGEGVNGYVGVFSLVEDGVTYYFIDNQQYFLRDGLYGYWDDGERFSYFSRAILETMTQMEFKPDIIHLNDWHCGPVAAIFKEKYCPIFGYNNTKVIFTIHNMKYQGIFPPAILYNLGLNSGYMTGDAFEYFGNVNFMKAGINFSDYITTVSKTYAKELQYPYFGEGLHTLINSKSYMMTGIVNGIDYDEYNPKTDNNILYNYDLRNVISQKKKNKEELQKQLGLDVDANKPMISIVTRLVANKGLDLIRFIFDELLEEDVQFVVLGTGEKEYEDDLKYFENKYKGRVSTNIYFSNELAKKIYASSDIFLMPSRFEPCGLGQLIAMRYGTIPVVRQTGGLNDTVIPYNRFTGVGTGFCFQNYNAHELLFTIKDALNYYRDSNAWKNIVKQAMKHDSSWKMSAKEYEKLYLYVKGEVNEL